ncbi:uncharacterized protein LOC142320102 [Lycorma delicatula]|uniref:uncharacterized protein LOC142320102 n=1 Tax=Lycorma delicatula TaxID=130591 RepID=UPI003F51108B
MVSPFNGGQFNGRNFNSSIFLIILSTMSLCIIVSTATRVNCRKFVFAPICRGVAAKRASTLVSPPDENGIYQDDNKPEMIDIEYPLFSVQDNESGNGVGVISSNTRNSKNNILFRELMQRRRKLHHQNQLQKEMQHSQKQQEQTEVLDPTIYDYK